MWTMMGLRFTRERMLGNRDRDKRTVRKMDVEEMYLNQYRQIATPQLKSMYRTNTKTNGWIKKVLKERWEDTV